MTATHDRTRPASTVRTPPVPDWPAYSLVCSPLGNGGWTCRATTRVPDNTPDGGRTAYAHGTTARGDDNAVRLLQTAVHRELHRTVTGTTPPPQ